MSINKLERVTGIEPAQPAWKAGALPLSYTRELQNFYKDFRMSARGKNN
jgi:hypothetical protein